jgi:hypothetical protein
MSFFAYEFIKPGIFPANLILSFPGHGRGKKEVLHSLLPKVLHACCQKLCILICEKLCILIYRSHCLIKSVDDEDLGYLGDANTTAYAATLRKVQEKCPQPKYIIVGHGNWSSTNALPQSIKMADALREKKLP